MKQYNLVNLLNLLVKSEFLVIFYLDNPLVDNIKV